MEDEMLESLLVFVTRFDNPHSMARIRAEIEGHGVEQFGKVGLGGPSTRSLSFHSKDSAFADWNHSFRVPQLDMLGSRIWRDITSEFRVVVCGLLDGQACVGWLLGDSPRLFCAP
eukprot:scaffold109968_cov67-Attheya_sp.AAC.1